LSIDRSGIILRNMSNQESRRGSGGPENPVVPEATYGQTIYPFKDGVIPTKRANKKDSPRTYGIPKNGYGFVSPDIPFKDVGTLRVELSPILETDKIAGSKIPQIGKDGRYFLGEPFGFSPVIWYDKDNADSDMVCHLTLGDLQLTAKNSTEGFRTKQPCAWFDEWLTEDGSEIDLQVLLDGTLTQENNPMLQQLGIRFEKPQSLQETP